MPRTSLIFAPLLLGSLVSISCGGGSDSRFGFPITGFWSGILQQEGGVICRGDDGEVFTLAVGSGTDVARVSYQIEQGSTDESGDSGASEADILVTKQIEGSDDECQLLGVRESDADLRVTPIAERCDSMFLNSITFVFESGARATVRESFDVPGEVDPETGSALCVINTRGELIRE